MRFMYRLVAITKSEFNSDTPLSCTFLHTDKWVPAPFWEKRGKEHRIRSPLQEVCPTKPSPAVCSVPNTYSLPLQIGTPGKVLKAETSRCSRRAGPGHLRVKAEGVETLLTVENSPFLILQSVRGKDTQACPQNRHTHIRHSPALTSARQAPGRALSLS